MLYKTLLPTSCVCPTVPMHAGVLRAAPPNAVFARTMDSHDPGAGLDVFLGSMNALHAAAEASSRTAAAACLRTGPGPRRSGVLAATAVLGIADGRAPERGAALPELSRVWAAAVRGYGRGRGRGPLYKRLLGAAVAPAPPRRRPVIANYLPQQQWRAQELHLRVRRPLPAPHAHLQRQVRSGPVAETQTKPCSPSWRHSL